MISKKLLIFLVVPTLLFSQEKMVSADFDGDKVADKLYLNSENGAVVYELSSQKFKKVSSDEFVDSGDIFLYKTKNGFKINLNQMRASNSYQFRYEKETGKMRLIGMEREEFGPANNDGSGNSSVNLLTNSYIGDWNYFDENKIKLVKIPTIKKKVILPKAYFGNLGNVFSTYVDQDVKYYLAEKKRLYKW